MLSSKSNSCCSLESGSDGLHQQGSFYPGSPRSHHTVKAGKQAPLVHRQAQQQLSGWLLESAPTSLMLVCLFQPQQKGFEGAPGAGRAHPCPPLQHPSFTTRLLPKPAQPITPITAQTQSRAPCSSSELKSGSHPPLPRPSNPQSHHRPPAFSQPAANSELATQQHL